MAARRCERLLFATAWPHFDFGSPEAIHRLSSLDDAARVNTHRANAREVLRFRGPRRFTTAGIETAVAS